MTAPWNKLFELIESGKKCCLAKNLSKEPGKEMHVMKICDATIINKFVADNSGSDIVDTMSLDPGSKFVICVIPSTTKLFVNLVCCNVTMANTMNEIREKISSHGIAIEGGFKVQNATGLSRPLGSYQGFNGQGQEYTSITEDKDPSATYFVVDNYSNIHFLRRDELNNFIPQGIKLQYVRGQELFRDGRPVINTSVMKDLEYQGQNVSGSDVVINYAKKEISFGGQSHSLLDTTIKMKYLPFFYLGEYVVIARDSQNNIIIFYHPNIDWFNLQLLLSSLDVHDAIITCNAFEITQGHVMWKEDNIQTSNGKEYNLNRYNHTDFIGRTDEPVNNVIVFSS
jgi:hypothetical protein